MGTRQVSGDEKAKSGRHRGRYGYDDGAPKQPEQKPRADREHGAGNQEQSRDHVDDSIEDTAQSAHPVHTFLERPQPFLDGQEPRRREEGAGGNGRGDELRSAHSGASGSWPAGSALRTPTLPVIGLGQNGPLSIRPSITDSGRA